MILFTPGRMGNEPRVERNTTWFRQEIENGTVRPSGRVYTFQVDRVSDIYYPDYCNSRQLANSRLCLEKFQFCASKFALESFNSEDPCLGAFFGEGVRTPLGTTRISIPGGSRAEYIRGVYTRNVYFLRGYISGVQQVSCGDSISDYQRAYASVLLRPGLLSVRLLAT